MPDSPGMSAAAGWKPTACGLCYVNCGVEVKVDAGHIVRVRGDTGHPRSNGYLCQKAHRLDHYVNHDGRLTTPLRRRPDGTFEPVDWDTAVREVAAALNDVRAAHGGNAFAFYGGGGQGNHLGALYGMTLLRTMGSRNYFNALGQEKTGDFWVNGHLYGAQNVHTSEDVEHCDLLVVLGCNPWQAHGFTNARNHLNAIRNDPARHLLVIDPIRTETADMADVHLQVRPAMNAFVLGALLARLVERNAVDHQFLDDRTVGAGDVLDMLRDVPVADWTAAAGITVAELDAAADLIVASERMVVRVDLGIQQSVHSTLSSYLEKLLYLLTGHFGRQGTNNLHTWLVPLMGNSRPDDIEPVTGQRFIGGVLPPSRLPEHVLADHPDRIRALVVDSANPALTSVSVAAHQEAFDALDLLVVVDVAFTETAAHADWVLPAASQFEKWEAAFHTYEWPSNVFQLRQPVLAPRGDSLPEAEIYTRIVEAMGDMPPAAAREELTEAAFDREEFTRTFQRYAATSHEFAAVAAPVLYRTFGSRMPSGSEVAAALWPTVVRLTSLMPDAVRAAGHHGEGVGLAGSLWDTILSSPSGVPFTVHGYDDVWSLVRHADRRVHLAVPELIDWFRSLDPTTSRQDGFPWTLVAGQRRRYNANQIFRGPQWRKDDMDGALRLHPDDLAAVGGTDGGWLTVESADGRVVVRAEASDRMRPGVVALPHGYGQTLVAGDGTAVVDGPRLNDITSVDWRDPIAATPYHKNVPVRLALPTAHEANAAAVASEAVQAAAGSRGGTVP